MDAHTRCEENARAFFRVFGEVFLLVRFYRKLYRTSQGYHAVAIPQEAAAALGLEAGGYVALNVENGRIVITPVKECA